MIVDRIENWRRYGTGRAWKTVFSFLENLDADSEADGRVALQGDDIYARIMSYPTRSPEEAVLEAHDQYIDIQLSLVNSERIGWFPRAALTVETPYNPEKDVVFFHKSAVPAARIDNIPGQFTVLFPQDAHMPQLMTGATPETVKKVVVKFRAALWGV